MMSEIKTVKSQVIDSAFIITIIGAVVLLFTYQSYHKFILSASLVGLFIYLGFILPRLIGRKTRQQRAYQSKLSECDKWTFQSRDREGPWINYIDYPLLKYTQYADNKRFYSEWLIIHDGLLIINPGPSVVDLATKKAGYNYKLRRTYSWDGCTPKKWFYWFLLIGTPDLWNKLENITYLNSNNQIDSRVVFWQKTHHASLVHDALYQYLGIHPISKREVDLLFYEMLRDSGMSLITAKIYHFFVNHFGASDIDDKLSPPNSPLKIKSLPRKKQ